MKERIKGAFTKKKIFHFLKMAHKVAHIRERQPREGAEQVEVAVQFLFGVFQFPLHQHPMYSRTVRAIWTFVVPMGFMTKKRVT